ncbi:hypothetical protein K505DRAFT_296976 [Melanomma pulvis-pyrius CBS 109.77]|uniref:Uncharacterized protein n=1 Tax=Melanomma pulvis-pyrius CBS 109.77 TaxID=1314802 RepID=A0A6A6XNT3_9PLEO|nr:hypothetical protein K505DRAFT_296976 [Melanomma pulvis-pyrius CBS 109.77]
MSTTVGHGQKVTTDPRSKQEIPESTGLITSDSLAAESLKNEGGFGSGNPHAAASKQPSKSTTSNITDTSNATRLAPAVDAEAREAQDGWGETSQLNASHSLSNSAPATDDAVSGGYAGAADAERAPGELRPKGKNITEGGFDDGAPNASFNNVVGGRKDPGSLAEEKFVRENAKVAGGGGGTGDGELTGESGFDGLEREEEA